MPVIWREDYAVGNELIDADHRYLFCLVNTVELAVRHPDAGETLEMALDQLLEYARFHFAREERIQYAAGYPDYLRHKRAHQQLLASLKEICRDIRATDQPGSREAHQLRLHDLLRQWLMDHVLHEDAKLKPHLETLPSSFV